MQKGKKISAPKRAEIKRTKLNKVAEKMMFNTQRSNQLTSKSK